MMGFEKIIDTIDDHDAELKGKQETDDKKKVHCAEEFDTSEDKHEAPIAKSDESITTTKARSRICLTVSNSCRVCRPALDFIVLSLRGKTIDFEKIIFTIDDLDAEVKVEQEIDKKKEYYAEELDTSEDTRKVLTKSRRRMARS